MNTLRQFASGTLAIPPTTAWYLADLGEYRGKQELYTRQSPQRLKALREHAMIESAVSSNRIEGVLVEPARVREVLVVPHPLFRDRDEEEVRGYRDALEFIHGQFNALPITDATVQHLHAMTRGQIWDAGQYKEKDGGIIERYPDGRERIRFRTASAQETPAAMSSLMAGWQRCLDERWVPPLLALAAFNLDFLCIHPFRDGNGRVSQLLWFPKIRTNLTSLFVISIFINIGMWFERYVIVVSSLANDYIPYAWGQINPTWADWCILAGSFGWFGLWFTLFFKHFPIVAIQEVKEMIPMPRRKGGH